MPKNQKQEQTDMEERRYDTTLQRPPRGDLRKDHAPNRDPDIDGEKMEKRDDLGGTSVYQKKNKPGDKGDKKTAQDVEVTGTSSGRELTDFTPKKENLIALMKIEEKLNICLKFMSGAMSEFYALKSIDISPDGKLGGRGYVMEMAEIRGKLYQSVENISAIIDTVYDEISGEHWMAQFAQQDPEVDAQFDKMEQAPDDLDMNFEKVSNVMAHVRKVAKTLTAKYETTNKEWGFWGMMKHNYDFKDSEVDALFDTAAKALESHFAGGSAGHGFVVGLLDDKAGRHLADDLSMHGMQRGMDVQKAKKILVEHLNKPSTVKWLQKYHDSM